VRLEHPNAPPERREIELSAGQRVVLEVSMKVQRSALDAGAPSSLQAPDAGLASP
jgi:serine/threonine-protein kinase